MIYGIQPFCTECGMFHFIWVPCETVLQYEESVNNPPETIKQQRKEILEELQNQKIEKICQDAIEEFRKGLLEVLWEEDLKETDCRYAYSLIESYNLPTK